MPGRKPKNSNEVKGFPKAISSVDLARAVGKSQPTVIAWDCPRNKDGTYDLPAVIASRLKAAAKPAADLKVKSADYAMRIKKANAELKEHEVMRRRGEFLPTEDVKAAWFEALEGFKIGLLGIPNAVAPMLVGLDAAEAARVIDVAIRKALDGLKRAPGV